MEIKSKNNNKGLYSLQEYKINTKIRRLEGDIRNKPTRTSIEIGHNKHIEDHYGKYMNHSFEPSCKIDDGYIVSIRDIENEDEITFNYNDSETKMAYPFKDNQTNELVSGKKTA